MLVKNKWFLLLIIIFVVFIFFSPCLDKSAAVMPFDIKHKVFYGETSPICKFIYQMVGWLTWGIVISSIIGIFINKSINNKSVRISAIIVLLALAIGPGLLVNSLFKNHWGRARPYQVLRDNHQYSPVWQPHITKVEDNSFSSGHAAMGFFLGVPLFVMGYRKMGFMLSLLGGVIVGIVRILQGGHYLSDVVFSGMFVWVSTYLAISLVNKVRERFTYCE